MIFIARPGAGRRRQPLERLMHGGRRGNRRSSSGGSRERRATDPLSLSGPRGRGNAAGGDRRDPRAPAVYQWVLELPAAGLACQRRRELALAVSAMTSELPGDGKGPETYRQILSGSGPRTQPRRQDRLDFAARTGPRLNDLSMYALARPEPGADLERTGAARLAPHSAGDCTGFEFANEPPAGGGVCLRALAAAGRCMAALWTGSSRWSPRRTYRAWRIAWHCVPAGRRGRRYPHALGGATGDATRGGASGATALERRFLESTAPI